MAQKRWVMIKTLVAIGLGSFVGGVLRYLVGKVANEGWQHSFPLSTFVVNVLGCLAIGVFYALFERGNLLSAHLRLFLTVGFCGGFTTFSTFANESLLLLRGGEFALAAFYVVLSLVAGLAALYAGYVVVKML